MASMQDKIITTLQDLIDENIKVEQQIESRTVLESVLDIEHILDQANEAIKDYENRKANSTEIVLDAELLKRNFNVVVKAIQHNSNITDRFFCSAIKKRVFQDDFADWNALCKLAIQHGVATTFHTSSTMLPFIDVKPKQHVPKKHAAHKRTVTAVEKRPIQSNKLARSDEGSAAVNNILRQIKNIYRAQNNQPIPYFKLICNPNNFMDTVQNALNISFLVKENLILLENGEDQLPQVKVITSSNANEVNAKETHQAICRLDLALCRKYAEYYNIKEPLLKRIQTE